MKELRCRYIVSCLHVTKPSDFKKHDITSNKVGCLVEIPYFQVVEYSEVQFISFQLQTDCFFLIHKLNNLLWIVRSARVLFDLVVMDQCIFLEDEIFIPSSKYMHFFKFDAICGKLAAHHIFPSLINWQSRF